MRELKIEDKITLRTPNIDRYFSDVGVSRRLTAEEEIELTNRLQAGDQQALTQMIRANLRFVISVAKQYSVGGDSLGDLIAQGNIGLIHAAKTFDHTRGFKFISYAVWHIRKEILEYLYNTRRLVRLPQHIIRELNRSRKIEDALMSELGRDVTLEEISDEMNRQGFKIDLEQLTHIRRSSENSVALESMDPDENFAPINWIEADDLGENNIASEDSRTIFQSLCNTLTPIEYRVVVLKLGVGGEPLSFREIGERHDRTTEWARQIFVKALKKAKIRANKLNLTT